MRIPLHRGEREKSRGVRESAHTCFRGGTRQAYAHAHCMRNILPPRPIEHDEQGDRSSQEHPSPRQ